MSKLDLEIAAKIYKPEVLSCPFCNGPLKYVHTVSNKDIQYSDGAVFRIRNLGYSCPDCNNKIVYFSQTANKLAFKGYTYSTKVVCEIAYYKMCGKGREEVCDILLNSGIEISDRNVDKIYEKFRSYYDADYDTKIKNAYKAMIEKFGQIRISLDQTGFNGVHFWILYDAFTSEKLAIWSFKTEEFYKLKPILEKYINKDLPITYIFTIRNLKGGMLVPLLRELAPENTKLISYVKYK